MIAKGDLLKEFKGAMAENFVLGSLLAQGYKTPHYWTISGNKADENISGQGRQALIQNRVCKSLK